MREVTAARAATLTGLSERTIRRRIAAGTLPARRIAPNRYAISIGDLPTRDEIEDAPARIEALGQRVAALEIQQRLMLRALGHPGSERDDEDAEDAAQRVDDLLLQLASVVARLSSGEAHAPRPRASNRAR